MGRSEQKIAGGWWRASRRERERDESVFPPRRVRDGCVHGMSQPYPFRWYMEQKINEVIFASFALRASWALVRTRAREPLTNASHLFQRRSETRFALNLLQRHYYYEFHTAASYEREAKTKKKNQSKLSHVKLLRFCLRTSISTLPLPIKCESINGLTTAALTDLMDTSPFSFGISIMRPISIRHRMLPHAPSPTMSY